MKRRHVVNLQIKGFDIEIRTDTEIPYEERVAYRETLESVAVFEEKKPLEFIADALLNKDNGIYYIHFSLYTGGMNVSGTIFEKE